MNGVLRGFAAIIDLLQFLFFIVFLGLASMTPVGGGAVAGTTGATICYNASGNVVSGLINAAYCAVVGAGIGALAAPIGIVIDVAISCTFGVLLILLLAVSGRFSFFPVMFGFVGEMTPGVNAFVPAWSILVHRCIHAYKKKQTTKAPARDTLKFLTQSESSPSVMAGVAARVALPRGIALNKASTSSTKVATNLITKNFDGIRRPTTHAQPA